MDKFRFNVFDGNNYGKWNPSHLIIKLLIIDEIDKEVFKILIQWCDGSGSRFDEYGKSYDMGDYETKFYHLLRIVILSYASSS